MRLIDADAVQERIAHLLSGYMTDETREAFENFDVEISNMPTVCDIEQIRADILTERECAYADFERYKVDYLGQDWEDVYDSLPQDDFRYGMERSIEIIDKYTNGGMSPEVKEHYEQLAEHYKKKARLKHE